MPWTVGDVDSHKKGLTDAQKKQWCKIANSVLQSCISDGGTDKTCAPSAIRQANGVVGNSNNSYSVLTFASIAGYTVKEVQHLGKKHLIVPVVMMVEGVHIGSHGSLLHKIEDLGKYPAVWNGIPIVIDHPEEEGQSISANEPDIIEEKKVGTVYHTKVKGKKLKAEAWLDEDKLRQVSSDVLANVKASEPVEVSVGVFADEEDEEGEFNGKEYSAIAKNHRPDHLALLPGGVGACSLEDGCGLRANSSNNKEKGGKHEMIRTDKLLKSIQSLKESGHALLDIIDNTSEGLMERLEAVRNKINSLDSNDSYHFIHEVYDDYVVYESRLRVGESKIYKQNYSFNSGVVELTGDPVQVHKKVEYVVAPSVNKFVRTKPVKNKEVLNMSTEKCTPCVEKKVTTLIGNSQGFTEDDRDMLQGLSEDQLDKLLVKPEVKPVVNSKKDESVEEEKPEVKPVVNTLSKEDQDALAFGKKQLAEKRAEYVKGIQANAKDIWSDEILNSMGLDTLERVFKSTKIEDDNDFSLNGESRKREINNNEADLEPLLPADCNVKPEVK